MEFMSLTNYLFKQENYKVTKNNLYFPHFIHYLQEFCFLVHNNLTSTLLLLPVTTPTVTLSVFPSGCYAGKDILPKGPVEGILKRNVTLKVLAQKKSNDTIIWYFRDRDEWINIATLHQTELNISDRYEGRASINSSNGYLTLSYLTCEDSGDYSITIIRDVVITVEITLRVLGEPLSKQPISQLYSTVCSLFSRGFIEFPFCVLFPFIFTVKFTDCGCFVEKKVRSGNSLVFKKSGENLTGKCFSLLVCGFFFFL